MSLYIYITPFSPKVYIVHSILTTFNMCGGHKKKRRPCLVFSLWCPEQDLNLHSFRNTHLKRARLPIPPPGHLVAFFESKRRCLNVFFLSCPGQDLNLHRLWRLPPQSSVSTNSTTWAKLSSFSLESGCKGTNIFRYGKTFFQLRVKS